MERILPIGTVVSLTNGTKKVMITGYSSKSPDSDIIYDYNGCIFPEGIMEEVYCLFDNSQIEEIFYKGYEDLEQEQYFDKMKSLLEGTSSSKALSNDNENINSSNSKKRYRTPKEPTNPLSASEMIGKYGVKKKSSETFLKGR